MNTTFVAIAFETLMVCKVVELFLLVRNKDKSVILFHTSVSSGKFMYFRKSSGKSFSCSLFFPIRHSSIRLDTFPFSC